MIRYVLYNTDNYGHYTFFIYLQKCLIFILFFGNRYEMLTNGKVQNKCKVRILGAKFGNRVGSGEAKALFLKVPTL